MIEETMTSDQIELHFHWLARARERIFLADRNAVAHAIALALGGGS